LSGANTRAYIKMKILFNLNQFNQQRQKSKPKWIFPVELSMYATYLHRQGNHVVWDGEDDGSFDRVITSKSQIDVPFLDMPCPDRILTDAMNPKWWANNGNFKHHPGTYTLAASGCSWGRCAFCVEKGQPYQKRSVSSMIQELGDLWMSGMNEVFDDSATFPDGEWLKEFCEEKIESGIKDLHFSCNMRIDSDVDFDLMKRAGFRMVLFGIESANQKTLDKLQKGINYDEIIPTIKQAARAGLEPHITAMAGCPGESDKETDKTIALVHYLLRKGYAKTAQCSVYTVEGEEPKKEAASKVGTIYNVAWHPEFWFNKLRDLRSWDDVRYLYKQIKTGLKEG